MMITQFMTTKQLGNLSRQRMRNIERKYRKKLRSLQRRIERADLPVRFNNTTVTAFGNFGLFQAFKEAIDFRGMLGQIHLKRHHNCLYTNVALLDTTIDALTLGLLRFSHMNGLRTDPGYQKIKETTQIADESTLREILAVICEQKALDRLAEINRTLLSLKARTDEPREVWLDIDDSVLTVFGNQEGAKKGYNPLSGLNKNCDDPTAESHFMLLSVIILPTLGNKSGISHHNLSNNIAKGKFILIEVFAKQFPQRNLVMY